MGELKDKYFTFYSINDNLKIWLLHTQLMFKTLQKNPAGADSRFHSP
jgi:hypothetical protein